MEQIKRVAIVGGTHGNELTGAYLVKKFEHSADAVRRSSFETLTLFGNPKAFEVGRRYVDKDLNRCFDNRDLLDPTRRDLARHLARELADLALELPHARLARVLLDHGEDGRVAHLDLLVAEAVLLLLAPPRAEFGQGFVERALEAGFVAGERSSRW